MKKMICVLTLMMVFVHTVSLGQEKGIVNIPAEDVPEKYIIKKGDTLWDLSEKFLGDPFEWPSVWKKNEYIKDPHWIYPGQTLLFLLPEKTVVAPPPPPPPMLKPLKKPEPLFTKSAPRIPKAEPEAPVAVLSPVAPPDTRDIVSKLRTPRPVFTVNSFMRTGFITKRSEFPKNRVVEIEGESANATKYDTIQIDIGSRSGVKEGDTFAALTVEDRVKHPDTGEDFGFVVRVKGIMTVISAGAEQARCRITENFDPVEVNDLVMPFRLRSGPMFDAWVKPDTVIKGTILAINEPMVSIHIYDILYIDKGTEDGVKPGDRFVIYRRENELNASGHREPLGQLEAVNVMPGETAVIVVSLKDKPVSIGDRVELALRCRLAK